MLYSCRETTAIADDSFCAWICSTWIEPDPNQTSRRFCPTRDYPYVRIVACSIPDCTHTRQPNLTLSSSIPTPTALWKKNDLSYTNTKLINCRHTVQGQGHSLSNALPAWVCSSIWLPKLSVFCMQSVIAWQLGTAPKWRIVYVEWDTVNLVINVPTAGLSRCHESVNYSIIESAPLY